MELRRQTGGRSSYDADYSLSEVNDSLVGLDVRARYSLPQASKSDLIDFKARNGVVGANMGATIFYANMSDHSATELSEKDTLKEIHHQVKNNLQVVCSLLRLQSRALKDVDARLAFKRSEERIQSMALVYDTLYRGASMFEVPFHEYISDLANQLLRCHSKEPSDVTLISELEPMSITSKAATTCGLIVNEVLSKRLSAVAALTKERVVKIVLSSDDTRVYLEVYDTAPSWDPNADSEGLSFQILQALVTQLQGAIEFGSGNRGEIRIFLAKKSLVSE